MPGIQAKNTTNTRRQNQITKNQEKKTDDRSWLIWDPDIQIIIVFETIMINMFKKLDDGLAPWRVVVKFGMLCFSDPGSWVQILGVDLHY